MERGGIMKEIIIIGGGPAGISAALYTLRANIKTTIIDMEKGALLKADKVDNYFGVRPSISGKELIKQGKEQVLLLGGTILHEEVVNIAYDGKFSVKTSTGAYVADSVVLATGVGRNAPNILGVDTFDGRGISYCAVCDAFFYRTKDVAVVGCCEYALSEIQELLPIVGSVTLLTNGVAPISNIPKNVRVIETSIAEFQGNEQLERVEFKDGTSLKVDGVFIAIGVAGSSDLARKLGVVTDKNRILIDDKMQTNIPGFFAAGDCTGGLLQIVKATHEGAVAGMEAVKYLRTLQ